MRQSAYVAMPDGVRLAIDVYRPTSTTEGVRVPTVLRATPYGRRPLQVADDCDGKYFVTDFLRAGYAVAMLDIRGTGASFGTWTSAWSPDEVDDLGYVIDWLSEQPWSNGRVAGIGGSYEANLAWLMASLGRPALAASVLRFPDFDPYSDVLWPGGIFSEWFISGWSDATGALNGRTRATDVVSQLIAAGQPVLAERIRRGPEPVDDDDGHLLALALSEHAGNFDVAADERTRTHRDDPVGVVSRCLEPTTPRGRADAISSSGTPLLIFASWLDASTAAGALRSFLTLSNPQTVLIGPWGHGAEAPANPIRPDEGLVLSPDEQFAVIRDFLDPYMLDSRPPASPSTSAVRFYVYGEDRWHDTTTWPPDPAPKRLELFLGPDGTLEVVPARSDSTTDTYTVDFTADAGATTRWHTQLTSGPVDYPHRAIADAALLTYTSTALDRAVTILGSPTLDLYIASTATDGAFYAYLEQVSPDGDVTYLTDGQLRAMHRAIEWNGHTEVLGPQHSYLRADATPLQPGGIEFLSLTLQPTAVTVPKGFRIRLALAGHAGDAFPRLPEHGTPVWTVHRGPGHSSALRIPLQQ